MDSLSSSSSFFSKLASPQTHHFVLCTPLSTHQFSPSQSLNNISSVRIEDKPQTNSATPTTTTSQTTKKNCNIQLPVPLGLTLTGPKTKTSTILGKFQDIINDYFIHVIDPPLRPAFDPRIVLSGNFAPVNELPPTECEVIQGSLQSCLDGVYIRDGPNPQHQPCGPYHLFDGDGMLLG